MLFFGFNFYLCCLFLGGGSGEVFWVFGFVFCILIDEGESIFVILEVFRIGFCFGDF